MEKHQEIFMIAKRWICMNVCICIFVCVRVFKWSMNMLFLRYRISVLRNADLNGMLGSFRFVSENTSGIWVENAAYEMAFYVSKTDVKPFCAAPKMRHGKRPIFLCPQRIQNSNRNSNNNNSKNHFHPKTTFV